jgi:hypothetical protein
MTDPGQQFRNDTSQKERAEVLKNDQAVQKNTFLSHTHSDEGGRYAKPQTVIGATPTVQYPRAAPNWSVDPTGVEPPLGHAIDAHEPVGEYGEVQASIEKLGDATEAVAQSSPLAGETANASVDDPSTLARAEAPAAVLAPASPAEVSPRPSPTPKRRE